MRSRTRLTAVASLVGLALAACGGGPDAASPGDAETASPPATVPGSPTGASATPTAEATSSPTPSETASVIDVRVAEGQVQGPGRVAVPLGGSVVLHVTSDVADEVHVHGYDLTEEVAAGGTATLSFAADIPGVFEVELEERHLRLLELEVRP